MWPIETHKSIFIFLLPTYNTIIQANTKHYIEYVKFLGISYGMDWKVHRSKTN